MVDFYGMNVGKIYQIQGWYGWGNKDKHLQLFFGGNIRGAFKICVHDSSLEVIIPNAGLHRTIQNDRGREGPHKKTIPKHQTSS